MEEIISDSDHAPKCEGYEKPYCRANCKWRATFAVRASRRHSAAIPKSSRSKVLRSCVAVQAGRVNSGSAERKHELLVAAARAVLASLREPIEERSLPRAALGALRMLEAAVEGADGRGRR
jgi:hypothetical protein